MDVIIMILQGLGIFVGAFVVYLLIIAFIPGLKAPKQPLDKTKRLSVVTDRIPPRLLEDVTFRVKGLSISASLLLPENVSGPVPCVVMGHGFGGTKDMIMESYALRYQQAGMAALAFDYRNCGESEGEPRQLILIRRQIEDYKAAIEYVRNRDEINQDKIALWGTSASGGYGLIIAAGDKKIACVCCQCPGIDHDAAQKKFMKSLGVRHLLRLVMHGQRDIVRNRLGLSAHTIPIVGKPGSLAMFPLADAYEGYSKLASDNFVNEVCARIILRSHGFEPSKFIGKVDCPILIQICDHDSLAPVSAKTEETLRKIAEVKRYPIGHFDIYVGDDFERSVSDQLEFFGRHLL